MSMTRRHFQAIADVMRYDLDQADLYPDADAHRAGCADRARRMANVLQHLSNNFNRARFLKDCGIST